MFAEVRGFQALLSEENVFKDFVGPVHWPKYTGSFTVDYEPFEDSQEDLAPSTYDVDTTWSKPLTSAAAEAAPAQRALPPAPRPGLAPRGRSLAHRARGCQEGGGCSEAILGWGAPVPRVVEVEIACGASLCDTAATAMACSG
eukprot:CAMPEP_0173430420 /NCGR_PEP_ID=MMETSP1357-20121228/8848_1 /TAXON_ID=77926 /ORGANISM="Hemiselmis rufescens, Strain PCC563" /LENGTH=142 /DNA_ID=CAMNT_0014394749 /DNA_START=42 /DNA_END=469 /DNA_ORIENTATION=+